MAQITPEQLVRAKTGDERALAGIISRMMPQVRFGAYSLPAEGLDSEDLVQEGLIGLMHAIGTYVPEKGVKFETYGASCIQNAQISALRAARRKKHGPLNSSVPLSEEQTIPGPEEAAKGDSYREIAEILGCTPKAVEGALARARRKLRSFL